jgi:hypothetical protein
MARLCVISRDYEHHVPRDHNPNDISSTSIHRGLASLSNQTFKDFNVVICHDGPKEKTYEEEGIDFKKLGLEPHIINTPEHNGLYGHVSADYAMRYAYKKNLGDYYIQFNIDNEFFPEAFQIISDSLNDCKEDILIFPIHHWKLFGNKAPRTHLIGVPPVVNNIDCMQLVAHKDIWKEVGFWHSRKYEADGIIYSDMCKKFPYYSIQKPLGHNF